MAPLPTTLAEAIQAELDRREWSHSKLARELETTEATVYNWLARGKFPNHAMYVRLCLLFDWPLPYSGDSSTAREISYPGWVIPRPTSDLLPTAASG